MDADRIVKLTPESIDALLASHRVKAVEKHAPGRRREMRWPFPGTIEVWLPEGCYGERHFLGTLHNLSPGGAAMRARRPVASDTRIALAIHVPELTCYGHAVVRHCTQTPAGYLIGMEFVLEPDEQDEPPDSDA